MSNRFWSASAGTLVSQLLIFAQGLLFVPMLIKLAGANTFGTYTLISAILSIIFAVSTFGVGFQSRRFLPSADTSDKKADLFFPQFWWQFASTLILGVILCIYMPELFGAYAGLGPFQKVQWGAILFYLIGYFLYAQVVEYFRYTHKVHIFNIGTVLLPYGFLAAMFIWMQIGGIISVSSTMCCFGASATVVGLIFGLRIVREIGVRVRFPSRSALFSDFKFGIPLVCNHFIETILAVGDRFIIAWILSSEAVGYYVPAYTIGSLMMLVPRVLGIALPVSLAQYIDSGDKESGEKLVNDTIVLFLSVAIPFVVGSALLGRYVLLVYTNVEISEAAWRIVPIVALSSIFYGMMYVYLQVLNVQLKTTISMKMMLYAAALNIGLNLVFIPIFRSILVAAYTTLFAYLVGFSLLLLRLRQGWSIHLPVNRTIRIVLASCLMGVVAQLMLQMPLISSAPFLGLIVVIGGSVIFYVAICLTLGVTSVSAVRDFMAGLSKRSHITEAKIIGDESVV